MGVKHCIIAFFLLMTASFFAQSAQTDSLSIQPHNKFELNLDLASRYLWRGQSWGGDYAVVQPTIDYHLTDHFSIGFCYQYPKVNLIIFRGIFQNRC